MAGKKLYLWCALLLSAFTFEKSIAQCYFHNIYGYRVNNNNSNEAGRGGIIQTQFGNYAVAGRTDGVPTSGSIIWYLDTCGDTLWVKAWNFSRGGDPANGIAETIDDGLVIAGAIFDTIEGHSNCYLFKTTYQGDSLWFKSLNVGFNDRAEAVLATTDGGFVMGGYYNWNLPTWNIFLVKTDSLGNVEWKHEYGSDTSYYYFASVEKTSDKGYIITTREEYNLTDSSSKDDVWIIKTDSAGNEQWRKNYRGVNDEDAGVAHAINTLDGGYAIVGAVYDEPLDNYISYCTKTDDSGNVQWMKYYNYSQYDFFEVIHQFSNGDYIAGGGVETSSGAQRIRLTKIKENGDHVWTKIYGYYDVSNSYDYLTDMIIDYEGNIVVTGYVIPPHGVTTGNDMFILKVDSAGELLTSTGNVLPLPGQAVSIYPNPAYDEFKVEGLKLKGGESYELKLYDVVGRNVLMEKLENEQISIDVSSLESGIYLWEVHDENEAIATGKLVKQ